MGFDYKPLEPGRGETLIGVARDAEGRTVLLDGKGGAVPLAPEPDPFEGVDALGRLMLKVAEARTETREAREIQAGLAELAVELFEIAEGFAARLQENERRIHPWSARELLTGDQLELLKLAASLGGE